MTDDSYRRHIERVRGKRAQAIMRTIARLRPLGITPWIEPRAGLFLWAKRPDGVDAIDVKRRALTRDMVLAPGNVFSVSRTAGNHMPLNVAMMDDPRLYPILEHAPG